MDGDPARRHPVQRPAVPGRGRDQRRGGRACCPTRWSPSTAATATATTSPCGRRRARWPATFRLPALPALPAPVGDEPQWAEHTATIDPGSAYLRGLELGTPDEQVTHRLDTAAHLARRWRAIRAHRSQTSPFEGLPEDLQRAFLTSEHLIEVLPEGVEQPVGLLGRPRVAVRAGRGDVGAGPARGRAQPRRPLHAVRVRRLTYGDPRPGRRGCGSAVRAQPPQVGPQRARRGDRSVATDPIATRMT